MTNKIFAGIVFVFCLIIYIATMAPSASFWDSGEFIAVSYNLGVTHPSGAPLYILIGNFFTSLFFFITDVGARVNLLSVVCSSLSVTLLYLIIVHLIKNWFKTNSKIEPLSIYISALIGSLLFAFTDSQWFNAVESEVYAMSMLSTALVVWLTLKWTEDREKIGNAKYIILTAYVFGLSIGVHPLNLLAIPFVIFTIYFSHTKDSFAGFIIDNALTFILGTFSCAILTISGIPSTISIILSIFMVILSVFIKLQIVLQKSPNISISSFISTYFRRISVPIISLIIFAIAYKGILMGFSGFAYQVSNGISNIFTFHDSFTGELIEGKERLFKAFELVLFPLFIILGLIAGLLFTFISSIKINVDSNSAQQTNHTRKNPKKNALSRLHSFIPIIKILTISVIMFYIGYSTYASVVIRAHKNPDINMNSPSTAERFKEFIYREQYGELVPIDLWGIFKYYLGEDNSSESEKVNFRTTFMQRYNEDGTIANIVEGKANTISSIPDIGRSSWMEIVTINQFTNEQIQEFYRSKPDIQQMIKNGQKRINQFLDLNNMNTIINNCGTLTDIKLKIPITNKISLDNILLIDDQFNEIKLGYHSTEDKIPEACDLPDNTLALTAEGHVLYNTSIDEISGFSFEVVNASDLENKNTEIHKIGSKRIGYVNWEPNSARRDYSYKGILESPNKERWLPVLQSEISLAEESTTLSNKDIMDFIINYQINEMYFRYFGWQFIGKEYEQKNFSYNLGTKNTAVTDNQINSSDYSSRLNAQKKEYINSTKNNISNVDWIRYGIPFAFIFGIIGMIYHFIRDPKNAFSVFILFIVTGLLILVYINQADPQPRERDYAYVGSFFAFSIWIGIGCMSLFEIGFKILNSFNLNTRQNLMLFILPLSCILLGVMPLNHLIQDFKFHNRSGNFAARDIGYNYLASCNPNSVLFTVGDNDTYPLWFNQGASKEHLNIRTINFSLLRSTWYNEQLYDNNAYGTIEFNFGEPFLTEERKAILEIDSRIPIEYNDSTYQWYLDMNENKKYDEYDSKEIISSLKDSPTQNKMNNFSITIDAIKRWDPTLWADIEQEYFKFELERALMKELSIDTNFVDLISFINPSNEEMATIQNIEKRISSKDFGSLNYLENLKNAYLEFYKNSYKQILKDFIEAEHGAYQNTAWNKKPSHIKTIWGKGLEQEGAAYEFPLLGKENFKGTNKFTPTINYKSETLILSSPNPVNTWPHQLTIDQYMTLKIIEDGQWSNREEFIDSNENGQWDDDEKLIDLNANDIWDDDVSVYFTAAQDPFGLSEYLEHQGLVLKLLTPSQSRKSIRMNRAHRGEPKYFNKEVFEKNVFEKYIFTNLETPGVYYSPDNQLHINRYWRMFTDYLNHIKLSPKLDDSSYYEDCTEEIKTQLSEISDRISSDVISILSTDAKISMINSYYAADLNEEYKSMMNDIVSSQNTEMSTLYDILLNIPNDNHMMDYKRIIITEILNKLDLEKYKNELYRTALWRSQIDFTEIYDSPILQKRWEGEILRNSFNNDERDYLEHRQAYYLYQRYLALGQKPDSAMQTKKEKFNKGYTDFAKEMKINYRHEHIFNNHLFDKNCNGIEDNTNIEISNSIAISLAEKLNSRNDILNEITNLIKVVNEDPNSISKETIDRYIANLFSKYAFIELLLHNNNSLQPRYYTLGELENLKIKIESLY